MAKSKIRSGVKAGIGLGIGALAAAVAGAYYLYGTKEGAKKRVKIQGWMLKAKGEVLEELEKMEKVDEKIYHDVINKVEKKYKAVKNIDPKELAALTKDLKKHWNNIKKQLNSVGKKKGKK